MPNGQDCRQGARQGAPASAVLAAAAALAVASVTPATAGDAELGRYLSSECMTCHGKGQAGSTIPNIFGLAESAFVEAVKAYRDKRLGNQVMQTIAGGLSDEDIAALAAYFATARRPQ